MANYCINLALGILKSDLRFHEIEFSLDWVINVQESRDEA